MYFINYEFVMVSLHSSRMEAVPTVTEKLLFKEKFIIMLRFNQAFHMIYN